MLDKNVKEEIENYFDKNIRALEILISKRKEMLINTLVEQFNENEKVKQINSLYNEVKDTFYYLKIRFELEINQYTTVYDDYKQELFSNDEEIQKLSKEIDELKLEKRNLILKLSSVRAGTKEYKEIIDKFIK